MGELPAGYLPPLSQPARTGTGPGGPGRPPIALSPVPRKLHELLRAPGPKALRGQLSEKTRLTLRQKQRPYRPVIGQILAGARVVHARTCMLHPAGASCSRSSAGAAVIRVAMSP
jgi:hypothetical protein